MALPNNSVSGSARDTIYALSSGAPPAAIAIVRISGPAASATLFALAGPLPTPRHATYRRLVDVKGDALDHALLLWLPGPGTATGEDLVELHLHGGRAVVSAVLATLAQHALRLAEPGEFTRRALFNGRLSLSEVEGLADLLAAETESQRREALRRADGVLGRRLNRWMRNLVIIAARIEAAIDYDGEDEVAGHQGNPDISLLSGEINSALAIPPAERLRDGLRVAIVGPPNAGKSTLFNALVGDDAAIVSAIAGTTRDVIERPLSLGGMPIVLLDTAGIRHSIDPIETAGVQRAIRQRDAADIILDLSSDVATAPHVIAVSAKTDIFGVRGDGLPVSALSGSGLMELRERIMEIAAELLPRENDVALDQRYRAALVIVAQELDAARETDDALLAAEHIRIARQHLDRLIGGGDVEAMLDALFGRFCLGK